MIQFDKTSLLAAVLIGLSLFLVVLSFFMKRQGMQRGRKQEASADAFKWLPHRLVKATWGQAGIELGSTYLLLLIGVSFGISFLIVKGTFMPNRYGVPTLLISTFLLPILVGKAIAVYQRIAFREGLIQWMYDAATQADIEQNFFRLTDKVMRTTRNKHTKRELQILLNRAHSEGRPLVEIMGERAELWNMPTYRLISVFSKVLVEAGGSLRGGYLFIRDTLERQKMRELRINKKTRANRVGSYIIVISFLVALIAGYHPIQSLLDENLGMKIWYYVMYADCLGVIMWLLWYTRRAPK